jgi:uncharacterized membrane protein YdjX (TVP38/TMEM64 family)
VPSFRKVLPFLVLIGGLGMVFFLGLDEYFDVDTLRQHREMLTEFVAARYLLSALLFCAFYAAATALSIPGGALLTVSGGFLFGSYFGAIFSILGATLGATLLFLAARTAFADVLRGRAGSAVERMRDGFQRNALSYLLFLRLVPLFPFFVVNLVPAFLGVRISTYVTGTFVGIIPGSLVFTLVGSGLDKIFASGEELSLASVFTEEMLLGFSGLALLALVPVIYKSLRGNPDPD